MLVAFSGGVDSTFLLRIAKEVLGDNVMAVTATSDLHFPYELKEAKELATHISVEHLVIPYYALTDKAFIQNPPDRCYWCKKVLFLKMKEIAKKHRLNRVVDGTNLDDLDDYRPGLKALDELEVESPLKEAGFTKADVREASKALRLPTWNKPSLACLASRFPYGTSITATNLKMVQQAEEFLRELGFDQFRVRHHNQTAKIELTDQDMKKIFPPGIRIKISEYLKKLGYTYVTLDLQGYRTGSLNEVLNNNQHANETK